MPKEVWPTNQIPPDVACPNIATPGPVFVREGAWIADAAVVKHVGFAQGRDHAYEVLLRGRVPGHWHVHSMMNIQGSGPITGPGKWAEVEGNEAAVLRALQAGQRGS